VSPLNGADDEQACLVFVSLTCPYCAQYHTALWNWMNSLPVGWRAEFLPVLVQGVDSFIQLKAVRAATMADPSRIGDFLRSAYIVLQQQGMQSSAEETWQAVVSASGYDIEAYSEAWHSLGTDQELIEPIVQRQARYGITATPTVVVGGRYVVTPDATNGDESLFIQLLNAAVSNAVGVA